ncbi:MAG: hypothetical protein WCP28_18385, partial [Actinomycetes bacterium]
MVLVPRRRQQANTFREGARRIVLFVDAVIFPRRIEVCHPQAAPKATGIQMPRVVVYPRPSAAGPAIAGGPAQLT